MDKTQQLMVFAIDDKLRTITMPNNGSVFGVSGDIEVNQVEFQMPRYCAGFDMTDFIGRVNYVNPNGYSRTIFRLRKIPNMYMVYPLKTNFRLIKYDISILMEHI